MSRDITRRREGARLSRRALFGCALVLSVAVGGGDLDAQQDTSRASAPLAKDIAVLVDMSLSVDVKNSFAARDLVNELIQGRVSPAVKSGWEFKPAGGGTSQELENLKAIFEGRGSVTELWRSGNRMLVTEFGNQEESRLYPQEKPFRSLNSASDIEAALREVYDDDAGFRRRRFHTRTFIDLAKASTAYRLGEEAKVEDFYLFLVSDGKQDLSNMDAATDMSVLESANKAWLKAHPYTGYDLSYITYWSGEQLEEKELGRFSYRGSVSKGMQPVDVIVYTSSFRPPPKIRSLTFFDPSPGEEKVIHRNNSWVQWQLEPAQEGMTFKLEFFPMTSDLKRLAITGITKQRLELFKADPDGKIAALPVEIPNGKYRLVVSTEEATPLTSETRPKADAKTDADVEAQGTVIVDLQSFWPEIRFNEPLANTVDTREDGKKKYAPYEFLNAAAAEFHWEAYTHGSDEKLARQPESDFDVVIFSTDSSRPKEIAHGTVPATEREVRLFDLALVGDEIPFGNYEITVSAKWSDGVTGTGSAAFELPEPQIELLAMDTMGGEVKDDRRRLRKGNAQLAFYTTHEDWPDAEYSAEVISEDGSSDFKEISREDDGYKVDLTHLNAGDYDVKIILMHEPRFGEAVILKELMAFVSIRDNNLLLYVFLAMASMTFVMFMVYFWVRGT